MKSLALILFAVLEAIPLGAGGSFSALDAALVLLLPVLVPLVIRSRKLRLLWGAGLCWSLGQVVIDFARGREFPNEIQLAGVMIPLMITGMAWLVREFELPVWLVLLSAGVGWLGIEIVGGQALTTANPWKYGLSSPIIVIALTAVQRAGRSWRPVAVVLAGFAGISLIFDTRSQAGMLLLTLLVVVLRARLDSRKRKSRGLVVVVLGLALLGYFTYPALALNGFFGDRAMSQQQQYEAENANYLLATRLEMPQMTYLAAVNLPFGIGSYGSISQQQSDESLAFLDSSVVQLSSNDRMYLTFRSDSFVGYNSHSAFMAAILYGGLAAMPFWIFMAWRALASVWSVLVRGSALASVVVYLCLLVLWDSFFSPMTAQSPNEYAIVLFALLSFGGHNMFSVFHKTAADPSMGEGDLPSCRSSAARKTY